jgi:hypothetical protein
MSIFDSFLWTGLGAGTIKEIMGMKRKEAEGEKRTARNEREKEYLAWWA